MFRYLVPLNLQAICISLISLWGLWFQSLLLMPFLDMDCWATVMRSHITCYTVSFTVTADLAFISAMHYYLFS